MWWRSRNLRLAIVGVLGVHLAGVSGCTEEISSPSLVERFRVLAVRAEPPEVAPGEEAHLDLLAFDPLATEGERPRSFLWLACATVPGTSAAACADFATQPDVALPSASGSWNMAPCSEPAGSLSGGGLCFLGEDATATYAVPTDFLDAGDASRQITFFVAAAAGERSVAECVVEMAEHGAMPTDCQVSYKRLTVSQRADRNTNPSLAGLLLDGQEIPEGTRVEVSPGEHALKAVAAEGAAEAYSKDDGTSAQEVLVLSWYLFVPAGPTEGGLPGTFKWYRTELPGEDQIYTAPDEEGDVTVVVVVRDDRGGVGWLTRHAHIAGQAP